MIVVFALLGILLATLVYLFSGFIKLQILAWLLGLNAWSVRHLPRPLFLGSVWLTTSWCSCAGGGK